MRMATLLVLRLLVAVAWRLLYLDGAAAAAVCANSGLVSPEVSTLVAAPGGAAWMIGPNCDWEKLFTDRGSLAVRSGFIERVDSLPPLIDLSITGNPLSRGGDFSNVTTKLSLKTFSPKLLKNIRLSSTAGDYLYLIDSAFTSLSGLVFPPKLLQLHLTQTELTSLKDVELPATLTTLLVKTSKLTAIDFSFPPQLTDLEISGAPIAKLENIAFPDSIRSLEFASSKISVVKGVTWPSVLDHLGFEGNPLTVFEIRASDVATFKLLTTLTGDFSKVKCTDASGTLTQVNEKNVCVISDERFESLYRSTATSSKPGSTKKPSGTTTASNTSSDDGDLEPQEDQPPEDAGSSSSAGTSANSPNGPQASTNNTSRNGSIPVDSGGSTVSSQAPGQIGSAASDSDASGKTIATQAKSSSNRTATVVFAVFCVLVAVVVAAWICRAHLVPKTRRDDETSSDDKYHGADTPGASTYTDPSTAESMVPSEEYLANDVRNDKQLLPFRIGQKDIKLSNQIARGGYGVIFRAMYQGRDVAVKQMLPGTWQDNQALASFMDEIRLCASLSHPKIVAFVGIVYTNLRDLSVVIEFMPRGDLHALLQEQRPENRSSQEWFNPWTVSQLKCKASIGQDVAEAVAYLHSLATPILHRDLKARNVLLDLQGNAKLSDFGISRELLIEKTMTSEVGTAAWIAPEVLRGARYSEKADIYSLGVLLVELDRCQHPYANEPALQRGQGSESGSVSMKASTMSQIAQKNTQIAVLVSTGKLRPSVSSDCPDRVAALVARCLSFDASNRPSATEVAARLDEVARSHD